MPTVSVFMPTYNQASFITKAIQGLRNQSFKDFEFIICDDGSSDSTWEVIKDLSDIGSRTIVKRHQQNKGSAEAINTCANEATSRLWTWISSDNVMTPDWLEVLVKEMDSNTNLGAVFSSFTQIRPNGSRRGIFKRNGYHPGDLISSENCFFGPSFLIRSEIWKSAGGHRGRISHDYDHWARVEEACWRSGLTLKFIPVSLCDYYTGPWQATIARKREYDAGKWRAEAIERRKKP